MVLMNGMGIIYNLMPIIGRKLNDANLKSLEEITANNKGKYFNNNQDQSVL